MEFQGHPLCPVCLLFHVLIATEFKSVSLPRNGGLGM